MKEQPSGTPVACMGGTADKLFERRRTAGRGAARQRHGNGGCHAAKILTVAARDEPIDTRSWDRR